MSKSYRFDRDDDGDGFPSRKQMKQARKQDKHTRREISRQTERMDGGYEEESIDVWSSITLDE